MPENIELYKTFKFRSNFKDFFRKNATAVNYFYRIVYYVPVNKLRSILQVPRIGLKELRNNFMFPKDALRKGNVRKQDKKI